MADVKKILNKLRKNEDMLEEGNIDLTKRPMVQNADGSISTVRSMGVNLDGEEVLIPTVSDDGRLLEPREAVEMYRKTGKHLGKFASPEASNQFAEQLHKQQEQFYKLGPEQESEAQQPSLPIERLRKEQTMKGAKERVVESFKKKSEESQGVFPDVYGTYSRKKDEGRPFLDVLKERLFEPPPAWRKKKP